MPREAVDRLTAARPRTLGQAGRLEGVTPSVVVQLLEHVHRHNKQLGRDVVNMRQW